MKIQQNDLVNVQILNTVELLNKLILSDQLEKVIKHGKLKAGYITLFLQCLILAIPSHFGNKNCEIISTYVMQTCRKAAKILF